MGFFSDDLLIQGTASLPNADCLPPDASIMDYTWSQETGPPFAMAEKTKKNKDLFLPVRRRQGLAYDSIHFSRFGLL